MNALIVESPTKVKSISKYLGKKFKVLASLGHVRALPSKQGSVNPEEGFSMHYEVLEKAEKAIDKIVTSIKDIEKLYLATDPDREGEAIAWHLVEVLKERKAINSQTTIERVVFNEITKKAVTHSLKNPRKINDDLVQAQKTRQALDYLVGFTLSPLLWKKLPGSRSAGRVQSVALRFICERENEINEFKPREYWSIHAEFKTPYKKNIKATLHAIEKEKLDKFFITNQTEAEVITQNLLTKQYAIASVEHKQTSRKPAPPFITSTLQQEAFNKLGFTSKKTMVLAQQLYEGVKVGEEVIGLITYMRTDGFYIADEALNSIRSSIEQLFGDKYLHPSIRKYTSKIRNAQEAHEAIRPTSFEFIPSTLLKYLSEDQFKLYDLIWKRTLASQMKDVLIDQTAIYILSNNNEYTLKATGSVIVFDGFYKIYRAAYDEDESGIAEIENELPPVKEKEVVTIEKTEPNQHYTQAPPRYSEASLIKNMESLGIGRPSTYATIISVLQDRQYVVINNKRFTPESRGRVVNAFLTKFFKHYVEYDFTANLEDELDMISNGKLTSNFVLKNFWDPFKTAVKEVSEVKITEVLKTLNDVLLQHVLSKNTEGELENICPRCQTGVLTLSISKFGIFLGCSTYPACKFTKSLDSADEGGFIPTTIGFSPELNAEIVLNKGPYGYYLQGNEKRVSLPKNIPPENLNLKMSTDLLSLPKVIGNHPDSGLPITVSVGPFGPYILYNKTYYNTKELILSLEEAVNYIKESKKVSTAITLGCDEKGKEISLHKGRFGYYIKCGTNNYKVPKGYNPSLTLSEAKNIIDSIKTDKKKKK